MAGAGAHDRVARAQALSLLRQEAKTHRKEEPLTQIIKALFSLLSPANRKKTALALTVAYGVLSAARDAVGAVLAALQ